MNKPSDDQIIRQTGGRLVKGCLIQHTGLLFFAFIPVNSWPEPFWLRR